MSGKPDLDPSEHCGEREVGCDGRVYVSEARGKDTCCKWYLCAAAAKKKKKSAKKKSGKKKSAPKKKKSAPKKRKRCDYEEEDDVIDKKTLRALLGREEQCEEQCKPPAPKKKAEPKRVYPDCIAEVDIFEVGSVCPEIARGAPLPKDTFYLLVHEKDGTAVYYKAVQESDCDCAITWKKQTGKPTKLKTHTKKGDDFDVQIGSQTFLWRDLLSDTKCDIALFMLVKGCHEHLLVEKPCKKKKSAPKKKDAEKKSSCAAKKSGSKRSAAKRRSGGKKKKSAPKKKKCSASKGDWQRFVKEHAGQGYSMGELSDLYHAQ